MECAWLYPDNVAGTIQKNGTIPRSGPIRIGYDLVSKNGTRLQEIYQGSGYLSQSTPAIFLGSDGMSVKVVWPSGASSTHPVDPATTETIISSP